MASFTLEEGSDSRFSQKNILLVVSLGLLVVTTSFVFLNWFGSILYLVFLLSAFGLLFSKGVVYGGAALGWGIVISLVGNLVSGCKNNGGCSAFSWDIFMSIWLLQVIIFGLVAWLWYLQQSRLAQLLAQAVKQNQATEKKESLLSSSHETAQNLKIPLAQLEQQISTHSTNNQQQILIFDSVSKSLHSLNESSFAVANYAMQLDETSVNIVEATARVKTRADEIMAAGENGAVAVEKAIASTEELRRLFNRIQKAMTALGEHQTKLKEVFATIKEISNETHLLALNATIEAAGAEAHGERFGVVAQEVKSLSDRAIRASREIGEVLNALGQQIQDTVDLALSSKSQTANSVSQAQAAGLAMVDLVVVIGQNAEEAERIHDTVENMSRQLQQIGTITGQQYNACSEAVQILTTVEQLNNRVTEEDNKVLQSVHDIRKVSEQLSHILADAV